MGERAVKAIASNLINENRERAEQAIHKPVLRGWFIGKVQAKIDCTRRQAEVAVDDALAFFARTAR